MTGKRLALAEVSRPGAQPDGERCRRCGAIPLVATEVPGLAAALGRPAVIMTLELERLAGETLHAALPFPDEVSARAH